MKQNALYIAQSDGVGGSAGYLSVADVSDKSVPKIVKTIKFDSEISALAVSGDTLAALQTPWWDVSKRAILIYDVSSALDPVLLSKTSPCEIDAALEVVPGFVFVSNFMRGFRIYDASDRSALAMLANLSDKGLVLFMKALGKDKIAVNLQKSVEIYEIQGSLLKQICEIKIENPDIKYVYKNMMVVKDGVIFRANLRNGTVVIDADKCETIKMLNLKTGKLAISWRNLIGFAEPSGKLPSEVYDISEFFGKK